MIKTGTIVKGIAGFYYVEVGGTVYECKARGSLKNAKIKPYIGDQVEIELDGDKGVITEIHPRSNEFIRPPVSNVEQFVVVSALAHPEPNLAVIDRFLVQAELHELDIVMCFTKMDLADSEIIEKMKAIYAPIYPTVIIDAGAAGGVNPLIPYLKDKRSALAGPSGVGKSTITSALRTDLEIETGSVSEKTKRGKHTTRHVELFDLKFGGMIFDTPGFTSFDIPDVDEADLTCLFPDIDRFAGECRFDGCRHINEPDCSVKEAVEAGQIHQLRYDSYCNMIKMIRERERKRYR